MKNRISFVLIFQIVMVAGYASAGGSDNPLSSLGLHVIPYPQEVNLGGEAFILPDIISIVLDKGYSEKEKFTATELIKDLKNKYGVDGIISEVRMSGSIILTKKGSVQHINDQGYRIEVNPDQLTISSNSDQGLFYGTQTLLQLIQKARNGYEIAGMEIIDWPDMSQRAVHYDTKHHQDKMAYVKGFIRDLAKYKINMLVWEWEDKLAYTSHPEIGAPGAFTIEEMQEFTLYAKDYHIQIVPLVQGLGHVSFILKWPQFQELRELEASNWEFCPLKQGSYDLLFQLWDEAIAATPGSEFIHIGSDETYELGMCKECKAKSEQIGLSGLYLLFVNKATEYLQSKGKKVMVWERPMGWEMGRSPSVGVSPVKGMVFTESYNYNTPDFKYVKEAKKLGYQTYAYDPNPGIEPLFLPYYFKLTRGEKISGSLENSYNYLSAAAISKAFDGMINTSWDDSGLHNQIWMLSFITSAEYSWSGSKPGLAEFTNSFFKNYYGELSVNMEELFYLLNDGSYYYAHTFERNVWHHGDIGKTHLPDLPRGDALEYDPYWNREYKNMVERSKAQLEKMDRALQIIENNLMLGVDNTYDFELFKSIATLIRHTCLTYLDLSSLEYAITESHRNHFLDRNLAYQGLVKAVGVIEGSLERRKTVYEFLKNTWEKTSLPKGLSTSEKKYNFVQDRARHYANRTPDLSYHIYDEKILDLEGYLQDLKAYMEYYRNNLMMDQPEILKEKR